MLWYIMKCGDMPWFVMKCHDISWYVIAILFYRYLFFSIDCQSFQPIHSNSDEDFSVFKSFDSRWERMTQISGQLHNMLRRALTFRFPFKRNRASFMASKDFHSFTVWRVTLSKNELCILLQLLSGPQVSQQQTMTHASNERAPLW